LGVSRGSLANWAGQADVNAGRAEGLTLDERDELRRLRREVKVLAEEREILKKAAAFFARDGESRRCMFIAAKKAEHSIKIMCRVLEVSPVGLSRLGAALAVASGRQGRPPDRPDQGVVQAAS